MAYDRTARDLAQIPKKDLEEILNRYGRRMGILQNSAVDRQKIQMLQAKAEAVAAELGFRATIAAIYDDAEALAQERVSIIHAS